jgi:hypothetical protein
MKKLWVSFLPMLILGSMAIYAISSTPLLMPQTNGGATLSDKQLYELALEAAQLNGLRGQPTEQTILKFPANQWDQTMFQSDIEGKTVFYLSVKGEIESGHMIGDEAIGQIREGLTVALDADDGGLWVVMSRYNAEPLSETADENWQLFALRQDPAYLQHLSDSLPPLP